MDEDTEGANDRVFAERGVGQQEVHEGQHTRQHYQHKKNSANVNYVERADDRERGQQQQQKHERADKHHERVRRHNIVRLY